MLAIAGHQLALLTSSTHSGALGKGHAAVSLAVGSAACWLAQAKRTT